MVNAMPRRSVSIGLPSRLLIALAGLVGAVILMPASFQVLAQQNPPNSNFERCRAIPDASARLRCYEEATSKPGTNVTPQSLGPGAGGWHLMRTRNPEGGKDAVSIMQTADITKSDIDLAGLMLRCSDGSMEVLIALIRPLPPRAHPKVTLTANGNIGDFTASVVPPGIWLLLPVEATALAAGPWQAARELSVKIDAGKDAPEPNAVHGFIPLTGLGGALPLLQANCSSR
jgi:hypothetical protein